MIGELQDSSVFVDLILLGVERAAEDFQRFGFVHLLFEAAGVLMTLDEFCDVVHQASAIAHVSGDVFRRVFHLRYIFALAQRYQPTPDCKQREFHSYLMWVLSRDFYSMRGSRTGISFINK